MKTTNVAIARLKKLFQLKYLLMAPAGIFFAFTLGYFLIWLIWASVHEYTFRTISDPPFVALQHYIRVFQDRLFYTSAVNTVVYFVIVTVGLQLIIGFALALLLNRGVGTSSGKDTVRRGWGLSVLFVPAMMAPLGIGLIWRYLLNTQIGLINQVANTLGVAGQAWLGSPTSALWVAILVNVWQFTPFVFIILLAGLQTLPSESFEAATVEGASKWQQFIYITLPLMKPIILVAAVFRVTDGFRLFDLIWALTAGGPGTSTYTLTLHIYREAFRLYDLGYGSAIAVVLLLMIFVFSGTVLKLLYSEGNT